MEVIYNTKWEPTEEGYTCIVKAVDDRDSVTHATVRVTVPVSTDLGFQETFGFSVKGEVEKAARGIAENIVRRIPE